MTPNGLFHEFRVSISISLMILIGRKARKSARLGRSGRLAVNHVLLAPSDLQLFENLVKFFFLTP